MEINQKGKSIKNANSQLFLWKETKLNAFPKRKPRISTTATFLAIIMRLDEKKKEI